MAFMDKDFDDPLGMYKIRTRQLRVRIQTLSGFLVIAKHPYSRAIIKEELNKCIDEYVARSLQQGTG